MTGFDGAFVALAAVQVLSVIALALGAMGLAQFARGAARQATPVVDRARAIERVGRDLTARAAADGGRITARVERLANHLRRISVRLGRLVAALRKETLEAREAATAGRSHAEERTSVVRRFARLLGAFHAARTAARREP